MLSGVGLVPGEMDSKTEDRHRKKTGEHSGIHACGGSRTGHGEKLGMAAAATRPYLADARGALKPDGPAELG